MRFNIGLLLLLLSDFISESCQTCQRLSLQLKCTTVENIQCPNSDSGEVLIDCNGSPYVTLKETHLANCNNLAGISVDNCLSNIEGSPFKNIHIHEYLKLRNNIIRKINNNMLNLGGNRILSLILLRDNGIEEIDEGSFRYIIQLDTLDLNSNQLRSIKYNVFNNIPVERLHLSNNKIQSIEANALSNMSQLRTLILHNNELDEFVASDILHNSMGTLGYLGLSYNKLILLSGSMLKGLQNLKWLYLDHNQISVIHPGTFTETPKLLTLQLTGNYLTVLSNEIFHDNCAIQNLFIGHNDITHFEPRLLSKLKEVKYVGVSGNPWSCNCLDLVLEQKLINVTLFTDCNAVYLEIERHPVCVVESSIKNVCMFFNDPAHRKDYDEIVGRYPELNCERIAFIE